MCLPWKIPGFRFCFTFSYFVSFGCLFVCLFCLLGLFNQKQSQNQSRLSSYAFLHPLRQLQVFALCFYWIRCMISGAWRRLHILVMVSDWFIALFPFVVIGQMCEFVCFTTVNCNPPLVLYLFNQKLLLAGIQHLFAVTRKKTHLLKGSSRLRKDDVKEHFRGNWKLSNYKTKKKYIYIFIVYVNRFHWYASRKGTGGEQLSPLVSIPWRIVQFIRGISRICSRFKTVIFLLIDATKTTLQDKLQLSFLFVSYNWRQENDIWLVHGCNWQFRGRYRGKLPEI